MTFDITFRLLKAMVYNHQAEEKSAQRPAAHFNDLRKKIEWFTKNDFFDAAFHFLDNDPHGRANLWNVLLLIKWVLLYGETKYPAKKISYTELCELIHLSNLLEKNHVSYFFETDIIKKGILILYNQQMYLQKGTNSHVFATQLKLYQSLKHKADIDHQFQGLTGITIKEFLLFLHITTLSLKQKNKKTEWNIQTSGFLNSLYFDILQIVVGKQTMDKILAIVTISESNARSIITSLPHSLKKKELQIFEKSFFTSYPLLHYNSKTRLVHENLFFYTANYYIYDFLKKNIPNFGTEFGKRLEKFIECSLSEMSLDYIPEKKIKELFTHKNLNCVDFYLNNEGVLIECKTAELRGIAYVNPTDEVLINALSDNILKSYHKQMLTVVQELKNETIRWGIIITYKEIFWGQYIDLMPPQKDAEPSDAMKKLPPENVFIMDITAWNKLTLIVRDKKATISEILENAKADNQKPATSKQLFMMHLDKYDVNGLALNFLEEEYAAFDLKKYKEQANNQS